MQILPSKELLPYIKHYLFLESALGGIKKVRLFSDGNTGMVFSFTRNLIADVQNNKQSAYLPGSFVYGQISAFKDLYLVNGASLVIVVFHPSAINRLSGIPAVELRDNIIGTEELFGRQGLSLQNKLFEQKGISDKVNVLNTFFTTLATRERAVNQLLIEASVQFIVSNKGANSMHDLVKHIGYTERHIERTFIECIGLSPKKYSNIVRLHNYLKLMKDVSRQNNLTMISYEAGYADQSHLIKEFRKYTGITPKEYLYKTTRLTSNFMQFNSSHTAIRAMSDLYNLPAVP